MDSQSIRCSQDKTLQYHSFNENGQLLIVILSTNQPFANFELVAAIIDTKTKKIQGTPFFAKDESFRICRTGHGFASCGRNESNFVFFIEYSESHIQRILTTPLPAQKLASSGYRMSTIFISCIFNRFYWSFYESVYKYQKNNTFFFNVNCATGWLKS